MTMPLQAVIFDLDGTLLDRRETFRRHLERQVERHRSVFPPGSTEKYVARLLELDENGTLDRALFHQLAEEQLGLMKGSSAVLAEDFERHYPESCAPFPNLFETLDALGGRGLKLGLVTNGRELIQNRKIDRLRIRPYLDDIVISEAVGVRKPDPEIFSLALSNLGVEAAAAAYVGDRPDADTVGARRSGLMAIWRRDGFWEEPQDVDWVIDDLSELVPIVLGDGERTG